MKQKRLMDLIGSIDDELIEEADKGSAKKPSVNKALIISLSSAAACLIVLISALYYFRRSEPEKKITVNTVTSTETSYSSDPGPDDPISVKTRDESEAGIMVSLEINEDIYKDYVFSSSYNISKEENGVFVSCKRVGNQDKTKYFTVAPEEISSSVILSDDEKSMVIFWDDEFGLLDPGKYKITCYAVSADGNEIIPVTAVFEIPEES